MKRHMVSTYSTIMIRRGVLKSKKTNSSIDADLGISCEKLIYIDTDPAIMAGQVPYYEKLELHLMGGAMSA